MEKIRVYDDHTGHGPEYPWYDPVYCDLCRRYELDINLYIEREGDAEEVIAAYHEHTGHGPEARWYFKECEWCRRYTMEEPYNRHTVKDYLKYTAQELKMKRFAAALAVKVAREEVELEDGDPRAPKALEYYEAERETINKAMQILLHEDGPPAQTVKVKELNFGSQAKI